MKTNLAVLSMFQSSYLLHFRFDNRYPKLFVSLSKHICNFSHAYANMKNDSVQIQACLWLITFDSFFPAKELCFKIEFLSAFELDMDGHFKMYKINTDSSLTNSCTVNLMKIGAGECLSCTCQNEISNSNWYSKLHFQ